MGKADEEPKFYLQEVSCPAAKTDRAYTVAQWIAHEGLPPYHRENDRFLTQVMTLTQAREARSEEFLQLLAGLWYDYSRAREGETLREKYEQAMRGAARVIDAVINL
jgi:hypothetical protein